MKILLTAYGGGHITAIIPTYLELLKRGHECTLLALTTAAEVAQRAGVLFSRPIDYIDKTDQNIQVWGARLAKRHHTEGKGLSMEESIAYLGVSFRDLAMDIGESAAWARYDQQGLNAFSPVHFMREILTIERPDVVVATTSPRMERAALRAAFQLDIPSLCMVELFGLLEESWLSRPDNGHVLAVSRQEVIGRLVAGGRDAHDIYLTGSPMFDQLADPALPEAGRQWRHDRGISDQEKLVFWAEQPEPLEPELPRKVRYHLAEICRSHGWKLVIRLHPSSTDASREQIPADCLQSHAHEPISHVIHACDVGVTLTSTVGFELLLSDKPLMVMTISPYSYAVTYGNDDGALALPSLDDAAEGLMLLLTDNPEAKRLAMLRQALPKPGGAAQRICNLIESTVAHRKYSTARSQTLKLDSQHEYA